MIELDHVLACDRRELILWWRKVFGSSPPKHTSTLFLQKALAHEVQRKVKGDVPKRTRKVLKAAMRSNQTAVKKLDRDTRLMPASADPPDAQTTTPVILAPGVQLVREWNGRTWQVDVLEDGFACRGKTYRSLSAIARMITGTRWSGPRFFGLT